MIERKKERMQERKDYFEFLRRTDGRMEDKKDSLISRKRFTFVVQEK